MLKLVFLLATSLLLSTAVISCAQPALPEEPAAPVVGDTSMTITSTAFADGTNIPVRYACNGENISPALEWAQVPAGTASFALIMEDPDAPVKNFTHWVVYNLPADSRGLPEAVTKDTQLAAGAVQGKNGLNRIGYQGPCPPQGSPHHYSFTLYALDKSLDIGGDATKAQVLQAMEGHIIAQSQLTGVYQR